MDERKRSLAPADAEEMAPSRKRVAKDENGQPMRMDEVTEKNVESYQKDAIFRQMKEYKRLKAYYEEQFADLVKKCKFHDDHLRIIDAWFAQLLDEIRLLAGQALTTPPPSATSTTGDEIYGSALLFTDNENFSAHLRERSANIKGAISDLFGRLPSASPDVEDLRRQLNEALAREKDHLVQLRTVLDEHEALTERLESASYRYMTAEKKLDRAKSTQVQKLERQAIMGDSAPSPTTSKKSATPVKKENGEVNGELENGTTSAEADAAHKEALAALEKQKAQVDEVEAENSRLTDALSKERLKLITLTDDDYASTSLFKTLSSKYSDVVSRVNDLESTNIALREEAQRLQSERTAYRRQLDDDNREQTNETEAQLARAETDLARIRNHRDELIAEVNVRKSAESARRIASDQARELAEARDARILALESEIERLKLQLGESESMTIDSDADDGLDTEALRTKLRTLQGQHSLLSNELASLETAWKKSSALASKKVLDIAEQEETLARLNAEKAKADQKYFAAMKAKDMREAELRSLKSQNARSSEIVTQLKDTEGKTRELVANLERQVAEAREAMVKLEGQVRSLTQKEKESSFAVEGLKKQSEEMKSLVGTKDQDALAAAKAKREAEVELEKVMARLEELKKQFDVLRKTRVAENSASSDDWRRIGICPVCNEIIRNTVLKLCGHVFCDRCVKDLISNRSRKCPSCGKAFGNGDYMGIVLT